MAFWLYIGLISHQGMEKPAGTALLPAAGMKNHDFSSNKHEDSIRFISVFLKTGDITGDTDFSCRKNCDIFEIFRS
jgi:hypothetical protein